MKNILYFILLIISFAMFSCGISGRKNVENMANDNNTIVEIITTPVKLEPLKDETLKMKGKDLFGEVIELKGEHIIVDSLIFKVSETECIIKDNFLLMKNLSKYGFFMVLSLPELRPIKTFGNFGRGPDEFVFPSICRNSAPDILATILETTNGKIYDVLPDGTMILSNINIFKSKNDYGGEYPSLMTGTKLYYVANSKTGKSVFTVSDDSIQIKEIQNLALNPKRKGWANYIGDFAVNLEETRMVYAYKYFKIVKFFDLENNTVRTIDFEREEFDESTSYVIDGLDNNITHYWGICPCEKYIYMLYIGRMPMQVANDNKKENYYIFVEKYDWNGQPIAKYRLDRWGFFTVDEKNNHLYLISTNDDDPFFRYSL
jgi:hypothetical protein